MVYSQLTASATRLLQHITFPATLHIYNNTTHLLQHYTSTTTLLISRNTSRFLQHITSHATHHVSCNTTHLQQHYTFPATSLHSTNSLTSSCNTFIASSGCSRPYSRRSYISATISTRSDFMLLTYIFGCNVP